MTRLPLVFASIAALALTGACAVTSAAVSDDDGRTVSRSLNDINAQRAVRARMTRAHGFKLSGVDVEVAEGVVVLSGRVPRVEDRIEAERIAWSAPRVDAVGNELRVGDKQGFARNARDGVVEKSVRTRLLAAGGVRSRNLNVEIHEGVVYLMGLARDQKELDRATQVVSRTRGVRQVVSYVRLQGGAAPVSRGYASAVPIAVPVAPPAAPANDFFPQAPASRTAPVTSAPLDRLPDDEPFLRDPATGERITLPPGTVVVPWQPDTPGSLGSGGTPPPGYSNGIGGEMGDDGTGAPFYIDPDSGARIPVIYRN